ncbi:sulfotransferase domain-containing protein [Mangrovimonas xylaniphaga]|uniref:sulfotransferase domain-containing protein n=1 Tax=Mangrovimonas xylaniphaga TaxID=1645915 RepID=UPI0006B6139E|nr:sulfotransferase domain-containing protein [Mangrovimonas xylaniphaga]
MEQKRLFIIGFPKCGTSSLFDVLAKHEAIASSSKKEPHFFMDRNEVLNFQGKGDDVWQKMVVTSEEKYNQLFSTSPKTEYLMEGSTNYIYSTHALENIRKKFSEVKIIVCLRDPVMRAFSAWMHLKAGERENLTFYEALQNENIRINDNYEYLWRYKMGGQYEKWISQLLNIFDEADILFINSKEMVNQNEIKKKCFDFLSLHTNEGNVIANHTTSRNEGGFIKNQFIHNLQISNSSLMKFVKGCMPISLKNKLRRVNYEKPQISKQEREYLERYFNKTYVDIEKMIGINFRSE